MSINRNDKINNRFKWMKIVRKAARLQHVILKNVLFIISEGTMAVNLGNIIYRHDAMFILGVFNCAFMLLSLLCMHLIG